MISVKVSGVEELTAALAVIGSPNVVRDILDEASAYLLYKIKTRFLAEKGPDGTPWVPSLASKIRKATGRGGGTLYDTGRLYQSLQVYAEGPQSRLIGTDVPYADKHQNGIGPMFRPFLGIGPDDFGPVTNLVVARIDKALGN